MHRVDPGRLSPPLLRSTAVQSSFSDGKIPLVAATIAEQGPDQGTPNSSTTERVPAGS